MDLIDRQAAIDAIVKHSYAVRYDYNFTSIENGMTVTGIKQVLGELPSAQPEIIRCKDCEYGEQDEVGRWFCRSLGCQVGNEDGSGYCADGERRETNETD